MKTILAIALWLLASSLAMAQDTRVPVAVSQAGDDQVGTQVALALKVAIRESRSFRLVDHEQAPSFPRIVIYLVSVAGSETGSAISEAIVYDSAYISGPGMFLNLTVQICGRDRVESLAKIILPNIAMALEYLRKDWPDLWRSLTPGGEYADLQVPEHSRSAIS